MERFEKITKKELIKMLEEYPDDVVFMLTTDLTKEFPISNCGKYKTKKEAERIAEKSKSIIYTGNEVVSHVDIHSADQPDAMNIRPIGIMNTIIMSGIIPK